MKISKVGTETAGGYEIKLTKAEESRWSDGGPDGAEYREEVRGEAKRLASKDDGRSVGIVTHDGVMLDHQAPIC